MMNAFYELRTKALWNQLREEKTVEEKTKTYERLKNLYKAFHPPLLEKFFLSGVLR